MLLDLAKTGFVLLLQLLLPLLLLLQLLPETAVLIKLPLVLFLLVPLLKLVVLSLYDPLEKVEVSLVLAVTELLSYGCVRRRLLLA